MIQKISCASTKAYAGVVQSKKVNGGYVGQNQPPTVSFTANPSKTASLVKKVGGALKSFFSNPDSKLPITDPYLNKSLTSILQELHSPNLFNPKFVLNETEKCKTLSLIHPVDGGLERVIKFDERGDMTNLIVHHPEPSISKREFTILQGGQVNIINHV